MWILSRYVKHSQIPSMTVDFFLIFATTVLITRVYLYFRPTASPTIHGFRLHHYMYGLVLIVIGLIVQWLPLYAIGLGLFVDELAFILLRGKTHGDNYSWKSLAGTVLFVIAVFLLRDFFILPFA